MQVEESDTSAHPLTHATKCVPAGQGTQQERVTMWKQKNRTMVTELSFFACNTAPDFLKLKSKRLQCSTIFSYPCTELGNFHIMRVLHTYMRAHTHGILVIQSHIIGTTDDDDVSTTAARRELKNDSQYHSAQPSISR